MAIPKFPGQLISKVNAAKAPKLAKLPKLGKLPTGTQKVPSGLQMPKSISVPKSPTILKKSKASGMKCKTCGSSAHKVHPKKHAKKHKNWIAGAIKHPGALHRELGIKSGHKIPAKTLAKAAKKGGKVGARARLAQTLKGFHHKK